ncbi:GDSL esterase/lipase At3g26430-like [Cucurbita moschata]|uniref:GDSL esterase/lipase At3g26430-like n=1 Tax=Cucurbita moschata TaxID=3662 RepID=A0A6J1G281_CUCMO|nr:GDSL esterase/lipase At3g26430-like [Cucurbita moschata]
MESHSLMFAVLALSLTPCSVLARKPCNFPAIFNFGDSNSDTGGFSAVFGQAPPPNGMSYFHGPVGRYSDGRLIVDFIAESLGLPYLSAYLNGLGANYSHGANFATAASTIRQSNKTLRLGGVSPISLDVQFNEFYDFHRRSQTVRNRLGGIFKQLLPKKRSFRRALYTFDIGQNDLTSGYFANMSVEQVRGYIPQVLDQLTTIVKSVHGQGGRFFWIHNTGPVGCLPYVLVGMHVSPSDHDQYGCAIPFNDLAQEFNRGLKEAVVELRAALPDAVITYVDIYSLKYALVSQHKKHGFEFPLRTCCGHGGKYNFNLKLGCGGTKRIHGKDVLIGKACKRPGVYVNWDGVHYTQAANKWIFNQIKTGAFSDPPIPLKMACRRA